MGRRKKRKRPDEDDEDEAITKQRKTLQGKVAIEKKKELDKLTERVEYAKVLLDEHKIGFTRPHFKKANPTDPATRVWTLR